MRSRMLVLSLLLLTSLPIGAAVSHSTAAPTVKWAIVNLADTTSIARAFVSGTVVFVHDDAKMASGQPCTSVHRFEPGKGPGEEIVAFHCTPRWGKAPGKFTTATVRPPDGPPVMTEYQFAGDKEAHIVPFR